MPITTPPDLLDRFKRDRDHFAHVADWLFEPAVTEAGYILVRPTTDGAEVIHPRIVRQLRTADLALCDISCLNPNVFLELGIRIALDRPVALVGDEHTKPPFDIGPMNCHAYRCAPEARDAQPEIDALTEHILNVVNAPNGRKHNSWWASFGGAQNDDVPGEVGTGDTAPPEEILGRVRPLGRDAVTFIRLAYLMASAVGARFIVNAAKKEDRSISLDFSNFVLEKTHRARIVRLGDDYGLTVQLVGGSS